jgi:hypothetical protein
MLDDLGETGLPEDIPLYLWHEVGHALIDPLVEKHWSSISKRLPIEAPSHYIKDIFSQAVSIRLFAQLGGQKAVIRHLNYEDPPERALLKPLTDKLLVYEKNPERYKTLEDFFPELVTSLPKK